MRALVLGVLVSAACLGACRRDGQPQPGEHVDAHTLQIEIGRYGEMLSQTAELTSTQVGAPDASAADPKVLARNLRETVWAYNIQRSQLCARNLYTEVTCTPAYEPVWISEPADATLTATEIQTRSEAVGQEVQRFWTTICDDARRRVQDRQQRSTVCAIE